jgi:hypothetical protein
MPTEKLFFPSFSAHKKVTKQFLLDNRGIRTRSRIRNSDGRIRIEEAQQNTDPMDPDQQHWYEFTVTLPGVINDRGMMLEDGWRHFCFSIFN